MTEQEIEKLKTLCEKEGFELDFISQSTQGAMDIFRVSKKDEWKGVEFAEVTAKSNGFVTEGKIYRIYAPSISSMLIVNDQGESGGIIHKSSAKPSTEAAYVEQLKATAHELYGEIKAGYRFDLRAIGYGSNLAISLDSNQKWRYNKSIDELTLQSFPLYKQGKWAKKVEGPIRVIVEPIHRSWDNNGNVSYDLSFSFKVTGTIVGNNNEIISKHLSKCLEDYLNKS